MLTTQHTRHRTKRCFTFLAIAAVLPTGCDHTQHNLQQVKEISAVSTPIGEACGLMPLVTAHHVNDALQNVTVTFVAEAALRCDNRQLREILESFLSQKDGYSQATELIVERLENNTYVAEKIN